jgi:hypothetical protein
MHLQLELRLRRGCHGKRKSGKDYLYFHVSEALDLDTQRMLT